MFLNYRFLIFNLLVSEPLIARTFKPPTNTSPLGDVRASVDTFFDILTTSIGGNFDKSSGESRFRECEKVWEHIDNINGSFLDVDFLKNK